MAREEPTTPKGKILARVKKQQLIMEHERLHRRNRDLAPKAKGGTMSGEAPEQGGAEGGSWQERLSGLRGSIKRSKTRARERGKSLSR